MTRVGLILLAVIWGGAAAAGEIQVKTPGSANNKATIATPGLVLTDGRENPWEFKFSDPAAYAAAVTATPAQVPEKMVGPSISFFMSYDAEEASTPFSITAPVIPNAQKLDAAYALTDGYKGLPKDVDGQIEFLQRSGLILNGRLAAMETPNGALSPDVRVAFWHLVAARNLFQQNHMRVEDNTLRAARVMDQLLNDPAKAELLKRSGINIDHLKKLLPEFADRESYRYAWLNGLVADSVKSSTPATLPTICPRASKLFYFFVKLPRVQDPVYIGGGSNDLKAADTAVTCAGKTLLAKRRGRAEITATELKVATVLADDAEALSTRSENSPAKASALMSLRARLKELRDQVEAGVAPPS